MDVIFPCRGRCGAVPTVVAAVVALQWLSCVVSVCRGHSCACACQDLQRPLHFAARAGKADNCRELLRLGADVNAKNLVRGWLLLPDHPVIHFVFGLVVTLSRTLVATYALWCYLVFTLPPMHCPSCRFEQHGTSPLMQAASAADRDVVAVLLQGGADVNAQTNNGITPLMLTASKNAPEVVQLLLDAGADVNVKNQV